MSKKKIFLCFEVCRKIYFEHVFRRKKASVEKSPIQKQSSKKSSLYTKIQLLTTPKYESQALKKNERKNQARKTHVRKKEEKSKNYASLQKESVENVSLKKKSSKSKNKKQKKKFQKKSSKKSSKSPFLFFSNVREKKHHRQGLTGKAKAIIAGGGAGGRA